MIVVMQYTATEENIKKVIEKLESEGFSTHLSQGVSRTIIGAIGDRTLIPGMAIEAMAGVEKVVPILHPYKLVSREFQEENSIIQLDKLVIGGKDIHVIAGPCAVESREQIIGAAKAVKAAGATMLRGGAFKPRTSPYLFQGLQEEGLKLLAEAREETGLPVVTECMDVDSLPIVSEFADIVQVGARNMQNFSLLKKLGRIQKPVILKRGMSSTIEEWLLAAEYIMSSGNPKIILCERGIRTFENYTRNTLDLSAVPVAKHLSHLPVIVDPSHGTGRWQLVAPMSRAAVAAGADGLLIEVHPNPSEALSDGPQSLTLENFTSLIGELAVIAPVLNRQLAAA
ncbi:MAG: 3-deoxy-7-phosphoheptulonate synthase [Bacillota bacterium]|jgi:3-deoxy-7-phosphoheptulonate synthase